MYKKPEGKVGFSFRRLITNAVPNFANDDPARNVFTSAQQDRLYSYQTTLKNPKILDDFSLLACGVVDNRPYSASTLKALRKIGVVSAPSDSTGRIHTDKITRHFPNQVPQLSIHSQRKVINMLFWWEEELVRWRLLDEEEAEIRSVLRALDDEANGEKESLKLALGTVWVRRNTPPSMRRNLSCSQELPSAVNAPQSSSAAAAAEDGEGRAGRSSLNVPPPDYGDLSRSMSISGGQYRRPARPVREQNGNSSGRGEEST